MMLEKKNGFSTDRHKKSHTPLPPVFSVTGNPVKKVR
jgi:hypothetical protein